MTRRVVSYLRVSSDDQRERQTIETQQDVIDHFLGCRPDLQLVRSYRDDGVSGSIPLSQRPAGRRLVQDATSGAFDAILVTRADRLGRDAIDLMQTRALFESLGIELIGVQEPMDDEMGFDMRAVWAKHEKKRFLARSAEGMERAAREGRFCGGLRPLGYRLEGKPPQVYLKVSDEPMWSDKTEADIVRWIFHLVGVEGWSARRVGAELNALGVPTVYGKDGRAVRRKATQGIWRAGRILQIVHEPMYKGEYHYGRRSKRLREPIVSSVPAIVSVELWNAAQQTLLNNRIIPTVSRNTYLLRGVVVCGGCGLTYCGTTGRLGVYWYRCNGQLVERGPIAGRCPSRAVMGPFIDKVVWADIQRFLRDPGDVLADLAAEMEQPDDSPGVSATDLRRRLVQLSEEQRRLVGLAVKGLLDADELGTEKDRIASERKELESRLSTLEATAARAAPPKLVDELLAAIRARVAELTMPEKQEIVRALVRRVTVHTSLSDAGKKELRIVVEYRFPIPEPVSDGVVLTDPGRGSSRR